MQAVSTSGVLVDLQRGSRVVASNTDLRGKLVPGDEVVAGPFLPMHVGGGAMTGLGNNNGP